MTSTELGLLGGFMLKVADRPVSLPTYAQRLLAVLALITSARGAHTRASLAERLWPDSSVARSQASLRTALWRVRKADPALVHVGVDAVRLGEAVEVDVRRSVAQAGRILSDAPEISPADARLCTLTGELLPGWDEDWLVLERQRIRQIQAHGLEALAQRLRRQGRYVDAIEAAYAAIAAEPLRESARAALIDVHLAEGNLAEARRHLDAYAALLWTELRTNPSPALVARVAPVTPDRPRTSRHSPRRPVLRPASGTPVDRLLSSLEAVSHASVPADRSSHRAVPAS